MQGTYIETDPVLLLHREKSYELHKLKIITAAKQIDNSSPSTTRLVKYISKTPMKSAWVKQNNSRIFNKLTEIYNRAFKHPRSLTNIKTSQQVNRIRQASKIALDNRSLAQRLITRKSTLSLKALEKEYKETVGIKEMISKMQRLKVNKGLIKKY